jgi:cell division protein FtsX
MDPAKTNVEKVDDALSESDGVQQVQVGGDDVDNMAASYWRSPKFIGSCIATILAGNNLYFGYAIPVNILNVINADIGKIST